MGAHPGEEGVPVSESIICPACGAANPLAAAFCTACGESLAGAAPPVAPAPADAPPAAGTPDAPPAPPDATTVTQPGLHDATRVHEPVAPTPPPPGFAGAPLASPAPSAPPPPAAPSGTAPWNPPASPPPPSWQQPVAPPGAATFGSAPVGTPASSPWAAPNPQAPPTMWSAEAPPAPPAAKKGSVLGGIAALLGGALALGGVLSPWVGVEVGPASSDPITGLALAQGDGLLKSGDPYLVAMLGVGALVVGVLLFTGILRLAVRLTAAFVGIAILVVAGLNWASIASYVSDNLPSSVEATTAYGFYLAIAGGVLTLLAAVAPAKR